MSLRNKLRGALDDYITDTFRYIHTVKDFIKTSSQWIQQRETEAKTMMDLKEPSESKAATADSVVSELQEELSASLNKTLPGLKKLGVFLMGIEKLAVTSLHVFEQNQVLQLSEGADLRPVKEIILVAQIISPLLVAFKRDNDIYFSPKIQNLEVMKYQLDLYIKYIRNFCVAFRKSSLEDCSLEKPVIDLKEGISDDDIEKMLCHINELSVIRVDENFRMVFLFRDAHNAFIKEFSDRHPQMLQFLSDLERCAVQLDDMNKGAKISGVVGSSVGAVGSVLSIVGLALTPVTAGASLALTAIGVGLGVTSGVNSLVTTATEVGVNHVQKNKADEAFQKFMEDVNVLQNSLDDVITQHLNNLQEDPLMGTLRISGEVLGLIKANIFCKCASVVATQAGALSSMSKLAADLPDVGQAVLKASSKAVRGGLIAANALFIGMDAYVIVNNSISLSKGSETEISKWIRARSALWSSEISLWEKIYDSLEKGLLDSDKKQEILRTRFY